VKKILVLHICMLLAGCGPNLTSNTKPDIYGKNDDISELQCRGLVLEEVAECTRQSGRAGFTSEERSYRCAIIIYAWENGYYKDKCDSNKR